MRDLVIIGAGGFGRETVWLVEEINDSKPQWNLLGFVDEDRTKWGQEVNKYPIFGGLEMLKDLSLGPYVVCAVSDPWAKKRLVEKAAAMGVNFATLVHPSVRLSPWVTVGKGTIISQQCIITVNVIVGNHVGINPGCGLGHDSNIGDYATLMWHVNISGAVQVGQGSTLGTKAMVSQGLRIGAWTIIGAGAVVTRDIPAHCTAVGVPAKPIKLHDQVDRQQY